MNFKKEMLMLQLPLHFRAFVVTMHDQFANPSVIGGMTQLMRQFILVFAILVWQKFYQGLPEMYVSSITRIKKLERTVTEQTSSRNPQHLNWRSEHIVPPCCKSGSLTLPKLGACCSENNVRTTPGLQLLVQPLVDATAVAAQCGCPLWTLLKVWKTMKNGH